MTAMDGLEQSVLAQLADDLPADDLRTVVGSAFNDLDRMIPAVVAAVAGAEAEHARRTAHAIAGVAGLLGAAALEKRARAIMAETAAGRIPDLATVAAMRTEAEQVRQAIRTFLATRGISV